MLTAENIAILDWVKSQNGILKINAVAGSGKTFILEKIASVFDNNLYMAYQAPIVAEAKTRFSKTKCVTTHALAHDYLIKVESDKGFVPHGKRSIGYLNPKDITEHIAYATKKEVISLLDEFCVSEYTDLKHMTSPLQHLVKKYYLEMKNKDRKSTFGFLLKYFHILLADGTIKLPEYDTVLLDEAQDTNAVTLEIFKLIKCNKKIMAGDTNQSIYAFNGAINGFSKIESDELTLSKSFRCSPNIAKRVEIFVNKYMSKDMVFEGTDTESEDIVTTAYISRTNTGLVDTILKLDEPFRFTRGIDKIFTLVDAIQELLEKGTIPYKYNEFKLALKDYDYRISSKLDHILKHYPYDSELKMCKTILDNYTPEEITLAKVRATNTSKDANIILTTAHSSKGLTFDEVYILGDFNLSKNLKKSKPKVKDIEERNLYYVACTRARYKLHNAVYL